MVEKEGNYWMSEMQFVNLFSDMFFVVKDERGIIVFPEDKNFVNLLKTAIFSGTNEIYIPQLKSYFRCSTVSHTENGKIYYVTRYLLNNEMRQIEQQYSIDETTGILTKKKAFDLFETYIGEALKTSEEFTAVMADIDFFKGVNDRFGHLAGDNVLHNIAQSLYSNTRHSLQRPADIIGRFGGEEFLVILKNISKKDSINRLNSLRESIAHTEIPFQGNAIQVTCSFGAIHIPRGTIFDCDDKMVLSIREEILKQADIELYKAKNDNRNNVKLKQLTLF